MNEKRDTRQLPMLFARAAFEPATVNTEKRTVDVVWTTGAAVKRGGFWSDPYWEILSTEPRHVRLERLNNGAPFLDSHNGYETRSVKGVVVPGTARMADGKGLATVRFARAEDDPEADQIFRKVKDGILQNISVGYRAHKAEDQGRGPDDVVKRLVTDWEPYEISVVPMGADDGAGFRSSDDKALNPCVFITPITPQERGMDQNETTKPAPGTQPAADPVAALVEQARSDNKKRSARETEAATAAAEEAKAVERQRIAEIRKLVGRTKLGDTFAQRLIETDVTIEKVREIVLDELAAIDAASETTQRVRIDAGDDEHEKFVRGASAWLFVRTGTKALLEQAAKKSPEKYTGISFDPGEFRGLSPRELARESLRRRGIDTRGMDPMKMIGLAFTYRTGYQMTGDFATMLENALGKVLLGAYDTQPNTWEDFCKVEEVPDFRATGRYRTGSVGDLAVVPEHGEFTTGIIPDASKYSVSTQTYGKMFGVSRQMIINDDMGALAGLATELGRAANRTIENAVYALLTAGSGLGANLADGQAFFYSSRGNINATGSALSVAGIDADRVVMRAQKDPNGKDYLDLQPAVLLVPDGLKGTANEINDAQFDFDNAGTNTTGKFMRPNKVRGLFQKVVGTPRLTGTRRYLFASTLEAIIVAFLEGQGRGPRLDSENGWRVEGVEWKVALDAKAQFGDPKAAVTNAGA